MSVYCCWRWVRGTGTGASHIIAKSHAKELNILTVGVTTLLLLIRRQEKN